MEAGRLSLLRKQSQANLEDLDIIHECVILVEFALIKSLCAYLYIEVFEFRLYFGIEWRFYMSKSTICPH